MIIQFTADMFIAKHDRCVNNTAKALDWVAALTLLVLGILGACNILAFSTAASYGFLGAGIIYTATMILDAFYINCTGKEARIHRFGHV